jgi:hypothetical protein
VLFRSNEGADGIAKLREEAQKYGVVSNEAAADSEEYLDAQARLKAALTGVCTELTSGLLPGLTETITKMADFIAGIDNWEGILTTAGYALAGLAAGLTAFLIVAKGSAVVHGLVAAFKALTAAIAANPIGAIAVVVTAVLIPALIALYKNWDTVQTYLQQGIARLQFAFKWLGSVIEEGLVVAFNTVKAAGASLLDFIIGNLLSGIGNMLEVMGQLPFVGEMFLAASEKVNNLSNAIGNMAEETRQASQAAIQAAHDKQDATQSELETTLAAIDTEAQARRAAIEAQKKNNEESLQNTAETNEAIIAANEALRETEIEQRAEDEEAFKESLLERLNTVALTHEQMNTLNEEANLAQIEQIQEFLEQRAELEKVDGEEKIAWLEEQKTRIIDILKLEGDEAVAITKAVDAAILSEEKKLKEARIKLLNESLTATSAFLTGVTDLTSLASKKNIGLLVTEKAAASAQALINSYLAFTKALASGTPPLNYIMAAGVLASGVAAQVKILSTPIPSAETGGRFIVPNSVGSDSGLMRVNSGEEVEVTSRGMTGFNKRQNILVQIDKQVIFDVVNEGINSNDILIAAVNY